MSFTFNIRLPFTFYFVFVYNLDRWADNYCRNVFATPPIFYYGQIRALLVYVFPLVYVFAHKKSAAAQDHCKTICPMDK